MDILLGIVTCVGKTGFRLYKYYDKKIGEIGVESTELRMLLLFCAMEVIIVPVCLTNQKEKSLIIYHPSFVNTCKLGAFDINVYRETHDLRLAISVDAV